MDRSQLHGAARARLRRAAFALLACALAVELLGCAENSPGESLFEEAFVRDDPARFAYVANSDDSTISGYLGAALGRLNELNYFAFEAVDTVPSHIVALSDREHFVVTAEASSAAIVLAVDPATGFLESVGFAAGLGFGPLDIALQAGGSFVYTLAETSRQITALKFDPSTEQLTQIQVVTTSSQTPSILVADSRGRYVMAIDGQAGVLQTFQIDTDGQLAVGSTASVAPNLIGGAAVDIGGSNVYISIANQDLVLRVAVDSGTPGIPMTLSTGLPSDDDPDVLATPTAVRLHPSGRFLYVLNPGADNIFFYRVESGTGTLLPQGALPSEPDAVDLVFEPEGDIAYLIDPPNNRLIRYAFDFETGILDPREEIRTRKNPVSLAFLQDTENAVVVPETLYVANERSSDVTVFDIDAAQGTLAPNGVPVVSGTGPLGLALDRRGRYLFVANGTSDDLTTFLVAADGTLSPAGPPLPLPGRPTAVSVEPSGNYLYVALEKPDQVVGFRLGDDVPLTSLGQGLPLGDDPAALSTDPTGQWLYVANSALNEPGAPSNISIFSIAPRSGTLTQVNPSGATPGGARSLGFAPNGTHLYTALFAAGSALPADISPSLGTIAVVPPPTPTGPGSSDITIASTGRYAWVAVRNTPPAGVVQLYDVRADDGALVNEADEESATPRQIVTAGMAPVALLADPAEEFLYVVGDDSGTITLFEIAGDGTLTFVQEIASGLSPTELALRVRID